MSTLSIYGLVKGTEEKDKNRYLLRNGGMQICPFRQPVPMSYPDGTKGIENIFCGTHCPLFEMEEATRRSEDTSKTGVAITLHCAVSHTVFIPYPEKEEAKA